MRWSPDRLPLGFLLALHDRLRQRLGTLLVIGAAIIAPSIASFAPTLASNGNAGVKVNKTVDSAHVSLIPKLKLEFGVDHASAIPGDTLPYTTKITNVASKLGINGNLSATSHADQTSKVVSYYDELDYLSETTHRWTPLAAIAAAQPGY